MSVSGIARLEDYVVFLREISGIQKVETDGKRFSVWLAAAEGKESEEFCITMMFGADSNDKIKLQSAEVSFIPTPINVQ